MTFDNLDTQPRAIGALNISGNLGGSSGLSRCSRCSRRESRELAPRASIVSSFGREFRELSVALDDITESIETSAIASRTSIAILSVRLAMAFNALGESSLKVQRLESIPESYMPLQISVIRSVSA